MAIKGIAVMAQPLSREEVEKILGTLPPKYTSAVPGAIHVLWAKYIKDLKPGEGVIVPRSEYQGLSKNPNKQIPHQLQGKARTVGKFHLDYRILDEADGPAWLFRRMTEEEEAEQVR